MTRLSRREGFTLIELILVIAIMGVATTMGIVMLFNVAGSWKVTTTRTALDANADQVLRYIGLDMAELVSSKVAGATVKGVAQTITTEAFYKIPLENDVLTIPVEIKEKGVAHRAEIVYTVDRSQGNNTLVRKAQLPGGAGKSETGLRIVPGVNVLAFRAEFLPRTPGGAWQAGWSDAVPPKAVRVTVTIGDPYKPQEQVLRKAVFPVEVN